MRFEAVTIKDIAKALGFSTSTVSRALRDSHEISSKTKEEVLKYAEQVNYRPNPIALSLKERRSRSIGVIVCEIANSFFSQAINGIESIAYDNGYNVIIAQSGESEKREIQNLQYLTSRSVDGLIISISTETQDLSFLNELHLKKMPIVFFDRIVDEIETHKVIVDNFQGGYDATVHLIKNGYKKIATVCNDKNLSISKDRLAGYKAALVDNGLEVNESMIKYCDHGGLIMSEVELVMDELLKLKERPDAIFAAADKLTTKCLRLLKLKGFSVPKDFGLVGYSNSDLADMIDPSLTVIRQPAFDMGQEATKLLLQIIESKRGIKEFQTMTLQSELLPRSSSQKMLKEK